MTYSFRILTFIFFFPVIIQAQIDTDNDGMPDEWEIIHGLDINDPTDAICDPDVDFVRNLYEYQMGGDPYDASLPVHVNVSPSISASEFKQLVDGIHNGPSTVLRMANGDYDFVYTLSAAEYAGQSLKVMFQGGWTSDHRYYVGSLGLGDCSTIIDGFNINKGGAFISDDDYNTIILHSLTAAYDNKIQITNGSYPGRISLEHTTTYGENTPQLIINQSGENNRADVLVAHHSVISSQTDGIILNQAGGDSLSVKIYHCSIGAAPLECNLNGSSDLNLEVVNSFLGINASGNSIICRQSGQNLGSVDIRASSSLVSGIVRDQQTGTTILTDVFSDFEDSAGKGEDLGWLTKENAIGADWKTQKPYYISSLNSECNAEDRQLTVTSLMPDEEFEISVDNINYSKTLTGLSTGLYDLWIRTADGCHYYRAEYLLAQDVIDDDDDDGMSNAWEDSNGLDRCDPTDAYCDTDGDQVINLFEYQLRTDPNDNQVPVPQYVTPQTTQQEYESIIALAGGNDPLYIRMQEGAYSLRFLINSDVTDPLVLIQGGWDSSFSKYDPFSQNTFLSGTNTQGNDIFAFSGSEDDQWSSFILDGLQISEGRPCASFTTESGLSHFTLMNCDIKPLRDGVSMTIRGDAVNHARIINCSVETSFNFLGSPTIASTLRNEATQYLDVINSNLEQYSDVTFGVSNIEISSSIDTYFDVDILNSIVYTIENGAQIDILDRISNDCLQELQQINVINSVFNSPYTTTLDPLFSLGGPPYETLLPNSPYKGQGVDIGLPYAGAAPDIGFNAALKITRNDFLIDITDASCGLANGSISVDYIGPMDPSNFVPYYASFSIDGVIYEPGEILDLGEGTYELWAMGYMDGCPIYLGDFQIENLREDGFEKVETRATCGESNGVITINPPGDISDYEYAIGDTTMFQASNVFSGLSPNVYLLFYRKLSDQNCIIEDFILLRQDSDIALTAIDSQNTSCGKDNGRVELQVTSAEGLPSFYIQGESAQDTPVFENLGAGEFTFIVEDVRNCKDSVEVIIATSEGIAIIDTSVAQPNCGLDNGSISLQVNDPDIVTEVQINGMLGGLLLNQNLSSGTYEFLVTDTEGCTDELRLELDPSVPVEIISIDTIHTTCALDNGAVLVSGVSGAPTEFSIDGDTYVSQDSLGGLGAGSYVLYAQNANCADTMSFSIAASLQPTLTLASIEGTACGEGNGMLDLDVISGTGPYTYKVGLMSNENGQFESLPSGEYMAYVQDSADCVDSIEVNIAESEAVVLDAVVTEGLCGELGAIELNASLGNANVYAGADEDFQSTSVFNELEGGEYVFYVRTEDDCLDTLRIEVPVYGIPKVKIDNITPAYCEEPVGSITLSTEGGKGALSVQFDGDSGGDTMTYAELSEGNYLIRVTDESGCTSTETVTVEATPRVRIEDLATEQLYCGDALSAVTFTPVGGTGDLSYRVTDNAGESVEESFGLPQGQYRLTVEDMLGCSVTELFSVKKEDCQIYIPNIFNPFGSEENSTFKISVPEASSFVIESFRVFDRWGNLVYNKENIDPLIFTDWWDGRYNGRYVEQGVYIYLIELKGETNELKKGSVTFMK